MNKPEAILFDWDNTLVDTWPVIHLALQETMLAMGKEPWSLEKVKKDVHRSMRDFFPELFGEGWKEAGRIYQQSYRKHRTHKLLPLPLADSVLSHLMKQNIYMAVVSNKIGTSLREEVVHLSWNHFFQKVIGAHDANEDKPSAAPVLMALEGSNITAGKHVWFIGDSLTDMECAHNTGCTSILYGEADPLDSKFSHCPPDKYCSTHENILTLLQNM